MDGKHPKRRKDKYNPYPISKTDRYFFLSFKDGQGKLHDMRIDQALYELFDSFELADISFLNEVDRHYEHSELTEASLNDRAFHKSGSLEDTAFQNIVNERLHKAISKLPEVQRRRVIMYFFGDLTYEQIAEMEGCTKMPVKRSIDRAIAELRKKLLD